MVDNETLIKMRSMRLSGMAECLESIASAPAEVNYTSPEIIKMMVDYEWDKKQNAKLARLQKQSHVVQSSASVHDLKQLPGRVLDMDLISRLSIGNYIINHQDVVLQGPTGSGKTYVACALANRACQQFSSTLYMTAAELFEKMTLAEQMGERKKVFDALAKVQLLCIDDWFLSSPSNRQVELLHTLIDRRHRTKSTIYCTQLPPTLWHERMEEKILADAIVDRIVSNSYITELDCKESLRKVFSTLDN
jgi:DNA replication protein DnaC